MLEFLQSNARLVTYVSCLVFFFLLETVWPLKPHHEKRWKHIARNLSIAVVNALIYGLSFAYAVNLITSYTAEQSFGLFRILELSWAWELALSILALDFVIYIWHILLHRIPFLWRFHLVHHVDGILDFTTGTRFHLGEMMASMIFHLPFYFLLGVSLEVLVVYQILLIIFTQLAHSNFAFPKALDNVLRKIFITSNFHQVHHSDINQEFNANYGTVFSFWDVGCRTYNERRDIENIRTGIQGYDKRMGFWELMQLPFAIQKFLKTEKKRK